MAAHNDTKKIIEDPHTICGIAKKLIFKMPGIYKGNLTYWIGEQIQEITEKYPTNNLIELAYVQLLREGYFFSITNRVYPPNKADPDEQLLTRFKYKYALLYIDFAILYELNTMGKAASISTLSRKVVSRGWYDDERELKIRIQHLFWKKLIKLQNESIQVNRNLIKGVVG